MLIQFLQCYKKSSKKHGYLNISVAGCRAHILYIQDCYSWDTLGKIIVCIMRSLSIHLHGFCTS